MSIYLARAELPGNQRFSATPLPARLVVLCNGRLARSMHSNSQPGSAAGEREGAWHHVRNWPMGDCAHSQTSKARPGIP